VLLSSENKKNWDTYAVDLDNTTNLLKLQSQGKSAFTATIERMDQITSDVIKVMVDRKGVIQKYIYPRPETNPRYYEQ
jgi:hypothetical protein